MSKKSEAYESYLKTKYKVVVSDRTMDELMSAKSSIKIKARDILTGKPKRILIKPKE